MKTIKVAELAQADWEVVDSAVIDTPPIFRQRPEVLKLLKEFLRYVVVGGLAFLVDYMVLSAMLSFDMYYLLATVVGFLAGLVTNYMLCISWVWRGTEARTPKDLMIFTLIGIGGLLLTGLLMWISVDQLHFDVQISKIFIAAVVLIWNFALRRAFVFFH